ncbi:MAG TPA: S1 RNA-binding domain-containing protein [Anaerolineales bacterium]|nr:S1 RNA-binding domain-containing protein [Anaerolineales bacterium]
MDNNIAADSNRTIEPKMQFTGKVVKVSLAGAVIDIGLDKPAVLHISQIVAAENTPVKRVEDVLKINDEVNVWVKRVAKKDGEERIELTMVQPLALEWREIKVGEAVKGKIVRLEKFGAFVEIGAERPGLVHISEMAHGYVKVPGDVVKEGDEIEAQVLEVNRRKKQIKLSMKALLPEPEEVVEEKPKPASKPASKPARKSSDGKDENRPARKPRPSGGNSNAAIMQEVNASDEPQLTAMEMALKEAMLKSKSKKQRAEPRKLKTRGAEQEDILERTLKNKAQND